MTKVLKIMDASGHSTLQFDDKSKAEAKAAFDRVMVAGGMAYRMEGTKGTQIKSFEEVGEETVLRPQLIGG